MSICSPSYLAIAFALGIVPGVLPTGPLNAITDAEGLCVGHLTLIEGDDIRTSVTAVLPHNVVHIYSCFK